MADFVQTMKDWRRMCKDRSCDSCNLKGSCDIDPDSRTDDDIRKIDTKVKIWAAEHPEPVYPTWGEWLESEGICFSRLTNYEKVNGFTIPKVFEYQIDGKTAFICGDRVNSPIPADIAQKLGLEPKEG